MNSHRGFGLPTLQEENRSAWKKTRDIVSVGPVEVSLQYMSQKSPSLIIGIIGWMCKKYCCTNSSKIALVGTRRHP